jgi:predicted metal-binding membrane protein
LGGRGQAEQPIGHRATDPAAPNWWRAHPALLLHLGGISLASWAYLVWLAGTMRAPVGEVMSMQLSPWRWPDFVAAGEMWGVMMLAMMLPSVAPTGLIFAAVRRGMVRAGRAVATTEIFLAGYVVVWLLFSAIAALAQGTLHGALLGSTQRLRSTSVAALVLAGVGLYQLTPLKQACLAQCRSPLEFLQTHWRTTARGVFGMGFRHGIVCVGCCWALMALLFVGGVMNLAWAAVIATAVLAEKGLPMGRRWSRRIGMTLVAAAIVVFLRGLGYFLVIW